MTTMLVSAAARRTVALPVETTRRPLTARAAAQHDGHIPNVLDRITAASGTVPSASAFQSAL
ncbi:hypothetical protein [Streptomyces violascens]|uniref:hypothetical protein n=1 Tax=Streptomyces violascens TaxID=67381 RepID=UPI0036C06A9C